MESCVSIISHLGMQVAHGWGLSIFICSQAKGHLFRCLPWRSVLRRPQDPLGWDCGAGGPSVLDRIAVRQLCLLGLESSMSLWRSTAEPSLLAVTGLDARQRPRLCTGPARSHPVLVRFQSPSTGPVSATHGHRPAAPPSAPLSTDPNGLRLSLEELIRLRSIHMESESGNVHSVVCGCLHGR